MRALIVYGTRGGGTAGLAHMIATAFETEFTGLTTRLDAGRFP